MWARRYKGVYVCMKMLSHMYIYGQPCSHKSYAHNCLRGCVCTHLWRWTHLSVCATVFLSTCIRGGLLGAGIVEDIRRFPIMTDSWKPWTGRIISASLRGEVSLWVSTKVFWARWKQQFPGAQNLFPGKALRLASVTLCLTCRLQSPAPSLHGVLIWSSQQPWSRDVQV